MNKKQHYHASLFRNVVINIMILTFFSSQLLWANEKASETNAANHNVRLMDLVVAKIEKKYEPILKQMPPELLVKAHLEGEMNLNAEIRARLDKLDKKELTPESLRNEASNAAKEVLAQDKKEILSNLQNYQSGELDELVKQVSASKQYEDMKAEYGVAFTHDEKVGVIYRAVSRDADQLYSFLNKRSGLYTVDHWKSDLNRSKGFYENKSTDWLKVLGIAALTVATVGLVTWGISAGIYGARLSSKREDYDNKLSAYRDELQIKLTNIDHAMDAQELQFLNDNGYVYGTCNSYTMPDSIVCNGLSYALLSGTMYCSVNCWKNPVTGKEARHEPAQCTSPFIPSNCYDPQEYENGKQAGYNDGYNVGYNYGKSNGYNDGYYDGDSDGYSKGKSVGYDHGYSDGFYDGYNSYSAARAIETGPVLIALASTTSMFGMLSGVSSLDSVLMKDENYSKGYQNGYHDAQALRDVSIRKGD